MERAPAVEQRLCVAVAAAVGSGDYQRPRGQKLRRRRVRDGRDFVRVGKMALETKETAVAAESRLPGDAGFRS